MTINYEEVAREMSKLLEETTTKLLAANDEIRALNEARATKAPVATDDSVEDHLYSDQHYDRYTEPRFGGVNLMGLRMQPRQYGEVEVIMDMADCIMGLETTLAEIRQGEEPDYPGSLATASVLRCMARETLHFYEKPGFGYKKR